MKTRGYLFLPGFAIFIMMIGIACNVGVVHPTRPTPTAQPLQLPTPTQSLSNTNSNTNGNIAGATNNTGTSSPIVLVPFTDQNNFYQIDVPSDWKHTPNSNKHSYSDRFQSPDGNALVENITYNNGSLFPAEEMAQFALDLLRQTYGTGQIGDIRVSHDQLLPDGTERLNWTSLGRGYSGLSYFKVQSGKNFMIFTIEWANAYQSQYSDILNHIYASYKIP